MKYNGLLSKMYSEYENPVRYYLQIGQDALEMNALIGKDISIAYHGFIKCECGKEMEKAFRQNLCYDCFYSLPQAGDAIFRPELSQAHLGIEDRDLEWEKKMQLQPHIVYLAVSSGLKVGITRKTQVPTRWIDQGASYAIALAEVPNRYESGVIELALKEHMSDKTGWQKMLKNEVVEVDLYAAKKEVYQYLPENSKQYYIEEGNEITALSYPVLEYPTKVKSLNLDKVNQYTGKLVGIKGQYLIFDDGTVFNVRNNERRSVTLSF